MTDKEWEEQEYKRIAAELAAAKEEAESAFSVESYEERQVRIYAEGQQAAATGRLPLPQIPKYIEIPVPKDWSQVGSMVVDVAGGVRVDQASQMEKRLNPAWVAMQEKKKEETQKPMGMIMPTIQTSDPSPNGNGIPLIASTLIGEDVVFDEIRPLLRPHGFRIVHFIQTTPDTVTITVSRA